MNPIITYDLSKVSSEDVVIYKSDENTAREGVDFALQYLFEQHPNAKDYEHWSFQKGLLGIPEWKGWHICGVKKDMYRVEDNKVVEIE